MKKFAAIILLSVHLFYIGGYTLVFEYLIHQSDFEIIKQIDNNKISESSLIEIKIPTNLPYAADWAEYKKVNGQLLIHGTYYNYVRMKLSHDTLSLMCIPNSNKTRLTNANLKFAQMINDSQVVKKKTSSQITKKNTFEKEFTFCCNQYQNFAISNQSPSLFRPLEFLLCEAFIAAPCKPPDFFF